MTTLSVTASSAYLRLSIALHRVGRLSRYQLLLRTIALRSMCDASNPTTQQISEYATYEAEQAGEEEWPMFDPSRPAPELRNSAERIVPPDDLIFFHPGPATGLGHWEFHAYDSDYFPSIPHGHLHGQPQPKLDAYLGWVYKGSKQVRREPRANIIILWNDQAFRALATNAINYYLTQFPTFNGWRVPNPRQLPRRRKP